LKLFSFFTLFYFMEKIYESKLEYWLGEWPDFYLLFVQHNL